MNYFARRTIKVEGDVLDCIESVRIPTGTIHNLPDPAWSWRIRRSSRRPAMIRPFVRYRVDQIGRISVSGSNERPQASSQPNGG